MAPKIKTTVATEIGRGGHAKAKCSICGTTHLVDNATTGKLYGHGSIGWSCNGIIKRNTTTDKPIAVVEVSSDQIDAWCDEYDGHPTEEWLVLVVNGKIDPLEFRAAVHEGRAPKVTP
jgi:hypothetical protein